MHAIHRIIPARAGFTSVHLPNLVKMADHPRSRGVYCSAPRAKRDPAGSSPLARGLHGIPPHPRKLPRIIPARAGFTKMKDFSPMITQDHPRSRGVYHKLSLN